MTPDIFANCQGIQEISNATEADLSPALLSGNQPVVLRGLIKHWPSVQHAEQSISACRDYLGQFSANPKVQAFEAAAEYQGRYFYNQDLTGFNFSLATYQFDQLLDKLLELQAQPESPSLYMGSTAIDYILPSFRQSNDLAPLKDKPLVSMWVGNQSRIAAHYDVTDNVACVVAGKRQFILFPPAQLDNLYVGPLDFTMAGQPASLVDFFAPDLARFPKFSQAIKHAQVSELEPGDAIFIPSMWWHHVHGQSHFNILVNYWWRQVADHLGAPMDALTHALLSIKDLPEAQRKVWRDIFDYYVFNTQEQQHIPAHKQGMLAPIDELTARKMRSILINKLNR
ncbi:cupin-like domain-containing protein [Paraglaciecola aestuariivivens]